MRKSIPFVYVVVLLATITLTIIAQYAVKSERVLSTEQIKWQQLDIVSDEQLSEDEREIAVEWEQ